MTFSGVTRSLDSIQVGYILAYTLAHALFNTSNHTRINTPSPYTLTTSLLDTSSNTLININIPSQHTELAIDMDTVKSKTISKR